MPDDINPYFVLQLMTPAQQRALAEKLKATTRDKRTPCKSTQRWLQAIELNATRAAEKSARLN
jgi:hypothetical protein